MDTTEITEASELAADQALARRLRNEGRLSPTLASNRAARLDFRTEAVLYLGRVRRGTEDAELARTFARRIDFPAGTKTIAAIPVHVAETGFARALHAYAAQSDGLSRHHAVIFLNAGPEITPSRYTEFLEERMREIREAIAGIPGFSASWFDRHFQAKVVLGRVRGIMADAVIRAALAAELEDPVLLSNDADQMHLPPEYLRTIEAAYHANELLDGTAGPIYSGNYDFSADAPFGEGVFLPELYLGDLFLHASDAVARLGEGGARPNFYTQGPNFAARLAAVCAMGGYDHDLGFKEDVEVGRRLRMMRMVPSEDAFFDPEHFRYLDAAYVVTSPRRSLRALVTDRAVVEQWSDFPETIGSDLSPEQLSALYLRRKDLLQSADIIAAAGGNRDALEKVRDRIESIFIRSAAADRIMTPERLRAIAYRYGLALRDCAFGDSAWNLGIDWERSEIFAKLQALAGD